MVRKKHEPTLGKGVIRIFAITRRNVFRHTQNLCFPKLIRSKNDDRSVPSTLTCSRGSSGQGRAR